MRCHLMWRLAPFYLALAAAPLLFGGIKPESQAILGILLALALLLTHSERQRFVPTIPAWLKFSILALMLLPLLPLPLAVVKIVNPERANLAQQFPINPTPHVVPSRNRADGSGSTPWLTLTTSPARTIQRLYELALALAAFTLARHAATRPGSSLHLTVTLLTALVLLAASDFWSRAHGRETVLGLWNISWGKGAGTFANRNHFANWIYVAVMFCAGWTLREFIRPQRKSGLATLLTFPAIILFAIAMAITSASRGGALSFLCGLAIFGWLLRKRFERQNYALAASFLLIAVVAASLLFGEGLIRRLKNEQTAKSLSYKSDIWQQTARLTTKFPIVGAGPGSFVRVYNYYKPSDGDSTFWHAENDFIELPLEFGIPCALLLLSAIFTCARKTVFTKSDTPLIAGIAGALVVFAVHATGEFISYVPANLILIATLLGFATGRSMGRTGAPPSDTAQLPITNGQLPFLKPTQLALSLALLITATLQFAAWHQNWQATRPGVERSLALWPFAVNRTIGLVRLEAKNPVNPARVESQITRALQLDPLNWELRLEQTWFQIAFATNKSTALSNAWLTIRLNPLQGQIPLRFARHFAQRDPDTALRFLAAVHPNVPRYHEAALDLAWQITRDPAEIWKLTPDTVPALQNVIHFAQMNQLTHIAAQAAQALEGRVDPEILAKHFLEAKRPGQALRTLGTLETFRALKMRTIALHQLSQHNEAVAAAQKLFALEPTLQTSYPVNASHAQLLDRHKTNPKDPAAAQLLAEKTAAMQPINLKLLFELAWQFPDEHRIAYLLFRAQLTANDLPAASQTAAALAQRL